MKNIKWRRFLYKKSIQIIKKIIDNKENLVTQIEMATFFVCERGISAYMFWSRSGKLTFRTEMG